MFSTDCVANGNHGPPAGTTYHLTEQDTNLTFLISLISSGV